MELSQQRKLKPLQAGDEAAFEIVFKQYYQLLCNYAYTFLHDRVEAEEVVQSAFLAFWEKRQWMAVTTSVKAYLFTMVRNVSLNALKHKKVELKHAQEELTRGERSVDALGQTIYAKELEEQIHKAIDELPETCKLIFRMSRFEELKYAEIADQLNISVKTVENQIGKALKIMREQLRDYLPLLLVLMTGHLK